MENPTKQNMINYIQIENKSYFLPWPSLLVKFPKLNIAHHSIYNKIISLSPDLVAGAWQGLMKSADRFYLVSVATL